MWLKRSNKAHKCSQALITCDRNVCHCSGGCSCSLECRLLTHFANLFWALHIYKLFLKVQWLLCLPGSGVAWEGKQRHWRVLTSSSRLLCSFCCSMRFCRSASSWRLYSSCSRICCSWRSCCRLIASERSLFSCCRRMKSRRRVDSPGTFTIELRDSEHSRVTYWLYDFSSHSHKEPLLTNEIFRAEKNDIPNKNVLFFKMWWISVFSMLFNLFLAVHEPVMINKSVGLMCISPKPYVYIRTRAAWLIVKRWRLRFRQIHIIPKWQSSMSIKPLTCPITANILIQREPFSCIDIKQLHKQCFNHTVSLFLS